MASFFPHSPNLCVGVLLAEEVTPARRKRALSVRGSLSRNPESGLSDTVRMLGSGLTDIVSCTSMKLVQPACT